MSLLIESRLFSSGERLPVYICMSFVFVPSEKVYIKVLSLALRWEVSKFSRYPARVSALESRAASSETDLALV